MLVLQSSTADLFFLLLLIEFDLLLWSLFGAFTLAVVV
jgi:hypothetical protein